LAHGERAERERMARYVRVYFPDLAATFDVEWTEATAKVLRTLARQDGVYNCSHRSAHRALRPFVKEGRRVDLKAILADKDLRRSLMVPVIQATQAREGIETTWAQAERAYDAVADRAECQKRINEKGA